MVRKMSAHPQHMNVVKHLICVWQWSGSHLGLVYSLNNSNMRLLASQKVPSMLGNFQTKSSDVDSNSKVIKTLPYAQPQHMRAVQYLLCVWQWSGSHLGWFYSLNKRTTLLFAPWEIWYQYLDSTAYEGCKTFMCLTMIWMKPSWMGLQPQLPHYTVVSVAPREIPWIRQHPKACLKRLARTQKGLIHMHIHSIWMW